MTPSTMHYRLASPVGVIADTHGLLRDEALALLEDCELILHLGDVGSKEEDSIILERLETLASVHCVRGNIDTAAWASHLPMHQTILVNDQRLHLVHRLEDADPATPCDVTLHGHSHQPRNERLDDRLLFNPGAAGKRRFKLPITLGKLWIEPDSVRGAIIHLPL
ncbi:metallophosphoesterase family protein [Halomonas sp. CUBES01]|uniref:Phosphoesterase n=1 Tax=Vreelandella gomseomensis TaxID=370766 RepID=A0ABU1GA08_9GAMM|nr:MULTISPECIES: metallophosphoesterase family protein [Halomonas]MDR5874137.1 metallophosphoesterase family protein [Halomonas gomseomensis]MEC4768808.1 metallophosphoesterase family protein [Halomonas sp. CUBES01]